MDAFSYLSVMLSIILGLAITQVLQGYRGLLLSRARVRLYGPTLIWSALMLLFATQAWWASFGLADYRDWTFAGFAVLLLQMALMYLMSGIVLPDIPAGETVDLESHYFRERRPFFALLLAMLCASVAKDVTLDGHWPTPENLAFHAIFAANAGLALVTTNRHVHRWLAPAIVLLTGLYIALLFARL